MSALEIIVLVVIGIIVGFAGDTLTPGRIPFGWLLAMVLGIVGAAIGGYALADLALFNLAVDGLAIVPAVVGAIVLVLVAKLLITVVSRRPRS